MSQTEVQLIKDAVIVNADVSNSAAIDVSKISGVMPLAGGTFTNDVTFEGAVSGRQILFDRSDNAFKVSDNFNLNLGSGNDLQLFHNGSNSFITNTSSGGFLHIRSGSGINLQDDTGDENFLKCIDNGAVELYHDNTKKLETHANGIHLSGSIYVPDSEIIGFGDTSNPDLRIFHNGNHSFIQDSGTGNLFVKTSSFQLENAAGNETLFSAVEDGAVELYHNGTKKLETSSTGATLSGNLSIDANVIHNGDTDTMLSFSANDQVDINCSGGMVARFTTDGISTGNNKRIDILDASGHRSGMINNSDSGANALRIAADPDNSGAGSSLQFHVDGTEQARIANGISFNGDTADANFLNDYEEGTFTPNNTIGMPLSSNFPAQYVKIGNLCWIMMDITFNSSPADTSQCGLIQNLPFTAKNLTNGEQYVDFPFISESGSANLDHDLANTVTFIESQGTAIKLFNFGLNAIQQRAFLAGRRMRFNFCYRTE